MITIYIFLGSSVVELAHQRNKVSAHIESLNSICEPRGVRFELVRCEDLSKAIGLDSKQERINRKIQECQYAYFIIGSHAGEYTCLEFDTALAHYRKTNAPAVYVYFLDVPDQDDTVDAFVRHFKESTGEYRELASNLELVLKDMVIELVRNNQTGCAVEVHEGFVLVNGQKFFSTDTVPVYQRCEKLTEARTQLALVSEELALKRTTLAGGELSQDAVDELTELNSRKQEIERFISETETKLLELWSLAVSKGRAECDIDPMERQALELIDRGLIEEANLLLTGKYWASMLENAELMGDAAMAKVRQYISSRRTLAASLQAMGMTKGREREVIDAFEAAMMAAEKWQVELDVLYEYAVFLRRQRHYTDAISIGKRCELRYKLDQSTTDDKWARLFRVLGRSYYCAHEYELAIAYNQKAIDILTRLSGEDREYDFPLVGALDGIASAYWKTRQLELRYAALMKARDICALHVESEKQRYAGVMAETLNSLAIYSNTINKPSEAEEYHKQAIALREDLTRENPDEHERDLARSYNNMGFLMAKQRRFNEAHTWYRKALDIRLRKAKDNPAVFEPAVALTLTNEADALRRCGRFQEAEEACRTAIEIRERYTSYDQAGYSTGLAISLLRMGETLIDSGDVSRLDEAHEHLDGALKIRRSLAEKEPAANEPEVARILLCYGKLLSLKGQSVQAESCFQESVALQSKYSKRDARADDEYLARFEAGYAEFLADSGRHDEALLHFSTANELYDLLAKANPEAYTEPAFSIRAAIAQLP